jgi:hypothetical protein
LVPGMHTYMFTVEIFLAWVYTRHYPQHKQVCDANHLSYGDYLSYDVQMFRVKVCGFGDRFQATEFLHLSESALVDLFILHDQPPYYDVTIYAFNHLPANSPVLQILIDTHCAHWNSKSDTECNGELQLRSVLPSSFWIGVSLRFMRLRHDDIKELNRCNYHRHEADEERGDGCKMLRIDKSL